MLEFAYTALPSHVVFGPGAARDRRLVDAADRLGARRVLVVAAEADRELTAATIETLGGRIAGRFSDVRPHVPIEVAQAARRLAAETAADAILSVGGGSTTGAAKAVALTTGLPVLAVPTTYAGSEVTAVWGLTENARKTTGTDLRVLPRVVVYDPELTVTLPVGLSVASGLNALAHCAESFWAPGRNPITSLIAEEGIRALAHALPGLVADGHDLDARSRALYGAWLAGTAFATAGSGVHHKVCHVLGGAFDLPHAGTHSVMLPHTTAVAAPRVTGSDERIAAALGVPGEAAADAIAELARRLGAPRSLAELGMRAGQLDEAIELVDATLARLPEPVALAATDAMIRAAFAGTAPMLEVGAR
ncbi:MAG: maleylacetate reductase [Solirubrobacteraceae bacterium]